ncbi:MAG: Membrane protein insertase YidC [Bacteroidia bacterium]|nr:Membrane protein insertase YidC [Bacteroidia bacterium]
MMDRNSLIGMFLILLIVLGYGYLTMPNEEELKAMKRKQDSIALVDSLAKIKHVEIKQAATDTIAKVQALPDSLRDETAKKLFGSFYKGALGTEQFTTLENEKIKVTLSNKGGKIYSVELKEYKTFDSLPVVLFKGDSATFALRFPGQKKEINTSEFYFAPQGNSAVVKGNESAGVAMRLADENNNYVEFAYTLKGNSYVVDVALNVSGGQSIIAAGTKELNFDWSYKAAQMEKSKENEANVTSIEYMNTEEEYDYLSPTSDDEEKLEEKLKWVAFKQQFFSSVLVSKDGFSNPTLKVTKEPEESRYLKTLTASLTLPYSGKSSETTSFSFYFVPNHYSTLKSYELGIEKLVPLGWGIFGWVNRFVVIPVFNFLGQFITNYGIIILLLTIIFKVMLLPLTYKAYMSTAKMRVLKPEIDEINTKYENKDAMEKQQAVMALYKKAGVNPLGGCLPMILQMPILIALFRFFPASIELRQKAFLWADDLSSYDSIFNLPFNIPFYGDHVSLFTLLMTITTIIYTKMNSDLQGSNPQMAQMKWIMYLMPIMFLGFFNSYASGLSYYYFLANMVTFGQQFLFKALVNEDEIHAKIQENKKKPVTKSGFQKKLEDIAKQAQAQQKAKKK